MPIDHNKPIRANELLQAFSRLRRTLGPGMSDVILEGLRIYDVDLESKKVYTLDQLRKALNNVCGRDATSLILERIEKRLQVHHKK